MPSPFSGMDPFIESCGLWKDFHEKLIAEIERAAAGAVPDRYLVRVGERAYVVLATAGDLDPERWSIKADVAITRSTSEPRPARQPVPSGPVAVAQEEGEEGAVTMQALVDMEFRESFVEIHALRPERRLVTTIEVLSPSNKRYESVGWNQYARKRSAHLEGLANLVEIDLLRGGTRMSMMDPWPDSPYYLLACRRSNAPKCIVWPAFFDRPLPKLHIPLTPPDDDVVLPLQPMIDAIYDRSRYGVEINYRQPCHPPLAPQSVEWLQQHLAESQADER
jgi:hypothetical protein